MFDEQKLIAALVMAVPAILILFFGIYRLIKDRPNWTAATFYLPVRLIDGDLSNDHLVMRRKVSGAWEYRKPTEQEVEEYDRDEAW